MTKATMADEKISKEWQNHFTTPSLLIDSVTGLNINKIIPTSQEILKEKFERDRKKGLKPRAIKAMVIGIPNVGKSTLINKIVGKKVANVGNKPGVTRAQQWIRINENLELLDTPGVLWPKFDDLKVGYHLALTGAIKDDVYHFDDVILYFLDFMRNYYPKVFESRYDVDLNQDNLTILHEIASKHGFVSNKEYLYERVYEKIINDFRNVRIGRITLDRL
jgi:ribosome biogenesis GTPase A